MLFEKGNPLVACVNEALAALEADGTLAQLEETVALHRGGRSRSSSDGPSSDGLLVAERPGARTPRRPPPSAHPAGGDGDGGDRRRLRPGGVGGHAVAGLGAVPGDVPRAGSHAKESFPAIRDGFWLNVKLFLICELVILVLGLSVALARQARSPWLMPLRVVAVVYTDVFRGIPTILLVLAARLRDAGAATSRACPTDAFVLVRGSRWSCPTARTSPRCSGPASTRSTRPRSTARRRSASAGPRRCGSWSCPQAVRRVVPPLLNDFVSLQKDTALVAAAGVFDAMFAARDYGNFNFNYTPLRRGGRVLRGDDRAAGALLRLAPAPVDGAREGGCPVTGTRPARARERPQDLRRPGRPRTTST